MGMLGIRRNRAYELVKKNREAGIFEVITIADRKRVTKDSFFRWYEGQSEYQLLTEDEMAETREAREQEILAGKRERQPKQAKRMKLQTPKNPNFYTVDEITEFYGFSKSTVRYWLKHGYIPGMLIGRSWRIPKDEFDDWMDYKNC